MNCFLRKRWWVSLLVPLLVFSCSAPVVKGNIFRTGMKEGNLPNLIERFHKGTFAIFPFKGIFENRTMGIATDGNAVSDLISIQMLYQGYKVLERDKMQKILEEKALKLSGLVEPSANSKDADSVKVVAPQNPSVTPTELKHKSADAPQDYIEIGKMLGVDFIVTGSIIQYEYQMAKGRASLSVTITTRIVDVQNGDIVFAMSAGNSGNSLPECLDRITVAFTDALKEGKVYVWE